MADVAIQQWAAQEPSTSTKSTYASLSGLLRSAAIEAAVAPLTVQELLFGPVVSAGPMTDLGGVDGLGLDSIWFENL